MELNELKHLFRIFPNLESIRIDAENILEYKIDVTQLQSLKRMILCVTASQEFSGEVDSQNNDDPNFVFGIEMDEQ